MVDRKKVKTIGFIIPFLIFLGISFGVLNNDRKTCMGVTLVAEEKLMEYTKDLEIDIANEIGNLTLSDVKFIEMDRNSRYAELDVSSFDCILSAVTVNEETDKVYDFSIPYLTDDAGNQFAFLVKTGNNKLHFNDLGYDWLANTVFRKINALSLSDLWLIYPQH